MIHHFKQFARLLKISSTLARYRLDELLKATHLFRPMLVLRVLAPRPGKGVATASRGKRLRLALNELGPVYVKFGQILSTRRDLLPLDIADELALLQDQVPPFPGQQARAIIEKALDRSVDELFREFDTEPLASASIAQVHAATLHDGSEVVVKVVRPGIRRQLRRDIDLLLAMASLAEKYWDGGERVRPRGIVEEFETFVFDELDMEREAANASMLRRNFENSEDLYVPLIHWPYCRNSVLVMERVSGLPVSDIEGLRAHGVNLEKLSKRGIRVFYTQVFRDNLFHADMHPGNILIDASDPDDASFIALDFGIVASLSPKDLYYISENFMALFNRDYLRVAQLHVDAGWVPADTRLDELESAVRTVGEPNFTRPLNEISFGNVMLKLFQVARRFNLTIQPQLIMLQKTLLNIEGLGRELYPDLDILAVAKPELESILREKHGLDSTARELANRLPGWLSKAPDMPGLLHEYLTLATRGQLQTKIKSDELEQAALKQKLQHRGRLRAVSGGSCLIAGALMTSMDAGPWTLFDESALGLILLAAGVWLMVRSARS